MPPAIVREYRALSSGAAVGVMTIELPSGMVLHGCLVLEKDGRRWVNPPSKVRVYGVEVKTSNDGRPLYDPVVTFADRAKSDAFSTLALAALDTYLSGGGADV